jgi:hypothetical protein
MVMVVMLVIMCGMPARIGSPQWAEDFNGIDDFGAKPFKHRLDYVIPQNEDAIRFNLCLQVPISNVPCKFGYMECITTPNLIKRLSGGTNFDLAPIFQHQPVAMVEHHRLCKIQKDFLTVFKRYGFAAQMTLIAFEDYMSRRDSIDHFMSADYRLYF